MKKMLSVALVTIPLISLSAYADEGPNKTCNKITGVWNATANIVTDAPTPGITCSYTGTVTVQNPHKNANFTADVALTLISGICPTPISGTITGTCTDGNITVLETLPSGVSYDLGGTVPKKGNSMPIKGTLTYTISGTTIQAHLNNSVLVKQ